MMRKILVTLACVLVVGGGGLYIFDDQVREIIYEIITTDMFVSSDDDSFSPGLAVGERFPAIKAIYQEREVDSVRQFVRDKGMVLIASRSADW